MPSQRRMPRYGMEEHARRGREIFRRLLLPRFSETDRGKVVAIDIDSEEFEVADDAMTATDLLLARLPDAQVWCERIGFPGVAHFGHWTNTIS